MILASSTHLDAWNSDLVLKPIVLILLGWAGPEFGIWPPLL